MNAKSGTFSCPGGSEDYWYDIGISVKPNEPENGQTTIVLFSRHNDWSVNYNGNKMCCATSVVSRIISYSDKDPLKRKIVLGNMAGLASSEYTTVDRPAAYQYQGPMQFVKIFNRGLTV